MICKWRWSLDLPDLPVVMASTPVGEPPDYVLAHTEYRAAPQILAAQAAVATALSGVILVDTQAYERAEDRVHLTERSAELLAREMVRAYLGMRSVS